jgi:Holliday junction resolvase RusA-like endonuclease
MTKIQIKPLSVNKAWRGRRFKTKDYLAYEQAMMYLLPSLDIPKDALAVQITFGFSNNASDIDNGLKPFLDILQKRYNFDDKRIRRLIVDKTLVKKGGEYIHFTIQDYTTFYMLNTKPI